MKHHCNTEIPNELLAEMDIAAQTTEDEIAFILREAEELTKWDGKNRRGGERRGR